MHVLLKLVFSYLGTCVELSGSVTYWETHLMYRNLTPDCHTPQKVMLIFILNIFSFVPVPFEMIKLNI